MEKRCSACKETKPTADFGKASRLPDGLKGQCRACCYLGYRRWLEGDGHKEQVAANQKRRLQADDGHLKAARRVYIEAHREVIAAAQRIRAAKHHAQNRDRNRARMKAYNDARRDTVRLEVNAATRIWKLLNKPKVLSYVHRRRARKAGNGGRYTAAEWKALCHHYDDRCVRCGEQKPLTIDHVIPLSRGGTNDIGNIQPLCLPCNLRKFTKIEDYRPVALRRASSI